MVAEGDSSLDGLDAIDPTLFAHTAIPVSRLLPIRKWRPRDGRNRAFLHWLEDIERVLAAFCLRIDCVNEEPPPASSYSSSLTASSISHVADATRAAAARAKGEQPEDARRRAWQRVNTSLYWHILPSILIDGPMEVQDSRLLASFYDKHLANGRKLLRWALQFVCVASKSAQLKLRQALSCMALPPGSDRARLGAHYQRVLDLWDLIEGHNREDPRALPDFYDDLLHSLPTTPELSMLTQVRTWLASRVADFRSHVADILPPRTEGGYVVSVSDLRLGH